MSDINSRFKELRMTCKKSQEEWGRILGITKSGVSDIENNRRKVTEQHLIMLNNWKDKSVNIKWLRTGEGDMFIDVTREEYIAAFIGSVLKDKEDTFKKRYISMLSELNDEGWEALEKIAEAMSNLKKD